MTNAMVEIKIFSGPDSRGRYGYFLLWKDNYFPGHPEGEYVERLRGQAFHGLLPAETDRRDKEVLK